MSETTLNEAGDRVRAILDKAFNETRPGFRLRMSNIGRPLCQLQLEKAGVEGIPITPADKLKFLLGDVWEIIVKVILKESAGSYKDEQLVELKVGEHVIKGATDCLVDNEIDDVKSASNWSFNNKMVDFASLNAGDAFGYVNQLLGYSEGSNQTPGGWWVANKETGQVRYVRYDACQVDTAERLAEIEAKANALRDDAPFEKCFTDAPETFRKKESGNRIIPNDSPCRWCQFRLHCWPTLLERPSLVSQGKNPPNVMYTYIKEAEDELEAT
jgi:hypothetical protein